MFLIQALSPFLIAARGLIVNISSLSADQPYLFAAPYAASKGALNSYSRVLRMELRPFNVRVMNVVTGTVRSNFTSHEQRELPSTSVYQPVHDTFLERLTFSQRTATMPTEKYAASVVAQALKGEGWLGGWIGGTPDWFYVGGLATLGKMTTWLPRFLAERAAAAIIFKMGLMAKRIQAARGKRT